MSTVVTTKLYAVRDVVPLSGNYACVPCGYVQYFDAGSRFAECLACLAGTPFGPIGYQNDGDEFWRYIG